MKDLSLYIKELLYNHDCVILPGFGGFIGNYTPARIDREKNLFSPPVKAISFNSNLSHNDGLLIGKLSEKKGIGYADSKRIVEEFINSLKSKLSKGERVRLQDIGSFYLNKEENIQFEPDNDVNFLLDSYGLDSFTRKPVEDYDISRAVIKRRDRESTVNASRRKMVWRAAIAVPFIAAMVIIPLKTDLFKSGASLNPLAKVQFEEIKPELENNETAVPVIMQEEQQPTTQNTDELTVEQPEIKEAEAENDKPAEVEAAVNNSGYYHLIAGSFKDQDNAQRMMEEAAEKGFTAEIIRASNGYYRVSLKSFAERQEAIDEKYRLRESYDQIWICKR